jgi:hypothetical protein
LKDRNRRKRFCNCRWWWRRRRRQWNGQTTRAQDPIALWERLCGPQQLWTQRRERRCGKGCNNGGGGFMMVLLSPQCHNDNEQRQQPSQHHGAVVAGAPKNGRKETYSSGYVTHSVSHDLCDSWENPKIAHSLERAVLVLAGIGSWCRTCMCRHPAPSATLVYGRLEHSVPVFTVYYQFILSQQAIC